MTPTRRLLPGAQGVSLSVLEAGPAEGPLTILLHGFPEDALSWRPQIQSLASAGLRVVAPDQRGYGGSDKPDGFKAYRLDLLVDDILALAAALGRTRFHLVGHDWGGVVAWRLAARHREHVERLVILNAPRRRTMSAYLLRAPSQVLRSSYIAAFQPPRLPERVLSAGDFALLTSVLRRSSRPAAFDQAEIARLRAGWSGPGTLTAMLNWYRALRFEQADSRWGRIAAPTLILWGVHDPFLERGLAKAAAALCDQPRIVWFEAAGHWLQREEPEAVGGEIARFLMNPAQERQPLPRELSDPPSP